MTQSIEKRIKIIEGFRPAYQWKGKSQEKKDKKLSQYAFLDYGFVMILLCLVIYASLLAYLEYDFVSKKWDNAALLVQFIMLFAFKAPFAYLEVLLKKHAKKIKGSNISFDEKVNMDLEFMISKFNDRTKYIYITGIPLIVIMLAAFFQVMDLNPMWDKFPVAVFAISLYLLIRINFDVFRLKRNIKKVNDIMK
ncbi:hypothetical protein [Marinifilum fragile]|uniref:hypothetical protein n=1 Tax=Marinifilum fragile TaxID=570161 RepID=UPI002AA7166D|nr:hypothetical protein [Marinifilum fragile]